MKPRSFPALLPAALIVLFVLRQRTVARLAAAIEEGIADVGA